jgi:predicted DNA-binding protein (MmcQ/YjbR family)
MPFGPNTVVFKVMGKMFGLMPLDTQEFRVSLKNTPDKNQELRANYSGIQGAFHMNKTHWSMFLMNEGIPSKVLKECVNDSYGLVVEKLTKALKAELAAL